MVTLSMWRGALCVLNHHGCDNYQRFHIENFRITAYILEIPHFSRKFLEIPGAQFRLEAPMWWLPLPSGCTTWPASTRRGWCNIGVIVRPVESEFHDINIHKVHKG